MARVFRRGSRFWLDASDGRGHRIRRPALLPDGKPCALISEARAALVRLEEEIAGGARPGAQARAMTLLQLAEQYDGSRRKARKPSSSRWRAYKRAVESYGAEETLASIDTESLLRWLRQVEDTPVHHRSSRNEVKPLRGGTLRRTGATVVAYFSAMRALLRYAVREGILVRDPSANIAAPRAQSERDRIVTDDELAELLAALRKEDARAVVRLCFETGMRVGEVANLRWSWVDRHAGVVRLPKEATKSEHARAVMLTQAALDALAAWERAAPRKLGEDRIFPMGGPYYSNTVWRTKKTLGKDYHLHDTRHSAATRLRRAGVDLTTTMATIGHRSWNMARRYSKVDDSDLAEARRKVEEAEARRKIEEADGAK